MNVPTVLEKLELKVGDVVLFDLSPQSDFLVLQSRGNCAASLRMRVLSLHTGNVVDLDSCIVDVKYEILRANT